MLAARDKRISGSFRARGADRPQRRKGDAKAARAASFDACNSGVAVGKVRVSRRRAVRMPVDGASARTHARGGYRIRRGVSPRAARVCACEASFIACHCKDESTMNRLRSSASRPGAMPSVLFAGVVSLVALSACGKNDKQRRHPPPVEVGVVTVHPEKRAADARSRRPAVVVPLVGRARARRRRARQARPIAKAAT